MTYKKYHTGIFDNHKSYKQGRCLLWSRFLRDRFWPIVLIEHFARKLPVTASGTPFGCMLANELPHPNQRAVAMANTLATSADADVANAYCVSC